MTYLSGLIKEIKTQASGAGSGRSLCTGISSAMYLTWLNYGRRESQATTTAFTSGGQSIDIVDAVYNPMISFTMKRFFEYKAALVTDETLYRNYMGLAQFYYEQGQNEMKKYEEQGGSKLNYGNNLARTQY
jgi:hypothetical protein